MPIVARILLAVAGVVACLGAAPAGAHVLFARGSAVPPAVQDFAWRTIEARCAFQAHERAERSFWAYRSRVDRVGGATGVGKR